MAVDLLIRLPFPPETTHRPRFGGKAVYTPQGTADYQTKLAEAIGKQIPKDLCVDEPLELRMLLVFPRPKYMQTTKHPAGLVWYTPKPDLDNLLKGPMDGFSRAYEAECVGAYVAEQTEVALAARLRENECRVSKGKKPLRSDCPTKKAVKEWSNEAAKKAPKPWKDDSRVTWLNGVLKCYAEKYGSARIVLRIRSAEDDPNKVALGLGLL